MADSLIESQYKDDTKDNDLKEERYNRLMETEKRIEDVIEHGENVPTAGFGTVYDIQHKEKNDGLVVKLYVKAPDSRNWEFTFDCTRSRGRKAFRRLLKNKNISVNKTADLIGERVPILKRNDKWILQNPPGTDNRIYRFSRAAAESKYTGISEFGVCLHPKYLIATTPIILFVTLFYYGNMTGISELILGFVTSVIIGFVFSLVSIMIAIPVFQSRTGTLVVNSDSG